MAGLNKVMLIGRLGKDPEVISFENGGKKMTVSLATGERYRDRNGQWQEQTEWHNIAAWGNLANDIDEKRRTYAKGDLLFIEGKIRTRQYQDAQGVTKYITEILAEKMNLISKSGQGSEGYQSGQGNQSYTQNTQQQSAPASTAQSSDESSSQAQSTQHSSSGNDDFSDKNEGDDLPF
ncbi:MAG: single-stranded DNA-binding protein [Bacteroidales bacterium]|jgi:single-strand DNA-binding protein|nr:single-stranded DNA-binding protein [Bacteroidales bacterium]